MAPHQGRLVARGSTLTPPSTMPALAALSLMVSNTLRMTLVWRSNCSMRASMISMAGVTYSVASSTSLHRDVGAFKLCLEHKGQLHLHARRNEARRGDVAPGRVCKQHVVQQGAVVGLGDLAGLLHGARGQADLVAATVRPSARFRSIQAR
jgi:hypothetical protein